MNDGAGTYVADANILSTQIVTGEALAIDPGMGAGVFVEYQRGGHWHIFTTCDTLIRGSDSLQYGYSCLWDLVASVDSRSEIAIDDTSDLEDDDVVRRVDPGAVRLLLLNSNDGTLQPEPVATEETDGGTSIAGSGEDAGPASDGGIPSAPGQSPSEAGGPDAQAPIVPPSDVDGVFLSAPAGAPMRLDVVLDGVHDGLDGVVPSGIVFWITPAPANSVDPVQVRQGALSNPMDFVPSDP